MACVLSSIRQDRFCLGRVPATTRVGGGVARQFPALRSPLRGFELVAGCLGPVRIAKGVLRADFRLCRLISGLRPSVSWSALWMRGRARSR